MYNEKYMLLALEEARKSFHNNEIPVGVVIVKNNKIISTAHNLKEKNQCILEHAELIAIREASKKLKNWRLIDCDIYVTLEPCEMCAAAIKQSRIKNIYSALENDDKSTHERVLSILNTDKSNPKVNLINNLKVSESLSLLKEFFISTRNK